ncbi:MAG: hypothetical protein L3I99_01385 [Sulfurimonas sp.]|nr:hypothetical protein [Sulfurimonas sp.]
MIKLFLLFLLPLTLFGSKILSYNVYDRTDRVDIMITFDTPYTGKIKKSTAESKIIIKLQDTSIESSKLKQISSKYLNILSITPMSNYVKIVASVPSNVVLRASKTADAYGLRLRFQDKAVGTKNKTAQIQQTNKEFLSTLPTKKDETVTDRYIIVVSLLIAGIIILFVIRKKVTPVHLLKNKTTPTKEKSWLFNQTNTNKQTPTKEPSEDSSVSIRFQKDIDEKNSVVMLDFMDQSYLVLMGTSNILLDKFNDNKPITQGDFESILQDKHQILEEFLSKKEQSHPTKEQQVKSYSQKASTISYDT